MDLFIILPFLFNGSLFGWMDIRHMIPEHMIPSPQVPVHTGPPVSLARGLHGQQPMQCRCRPEVGVCSSRLGSTFFFPWTRFQHSNVARHALTTMWT